MTGIYRLADLNISVTSVGADVHKLCRDYATDGAADFSVTTTEEDVNAEREVSARDDIANGRAVHSYSDGYLETLAVYRKIAEMLPYYDAFLFHGSCVAVDGKGYLFTAKSGTGKSTHARLWRNLLGDRAVMINDDKPLIRMKDEGIFIYGTPWDGKHRLSTNTSVPLKAVCMLFRGEKNGISPASVDDSFAMLLQQIYRPKDKEAMRKTMILLDNLKSRVSLWRLYCNMEPEAAVISYNAMKG